MKPLVTAKDMYLRRGAHFCLQISHMQIKAGTLLCLSGPNGGGKTTLLNCLCGLATPTYGTISVDGQPIDRNLRSTKAVTGLIPDDEGWFVSELSAREYFKLLTEIYRQAGVAIANMPAYIDQLAEALYFTALDQPLGSLSHGNKKKAQIIAGLMHRPKLLLVDELRNGLDPLAIQAAEALLVKEVERGACVVAATHDLWWAQRIANEIAIIVDGKLLHVCDVQQAVHKYGSLEKLFMQSIRKRPVTNACV